MRPPNPILVVLTVALVVIVVQGRDVNPNQLLADLGFSSWCFSQIPSCCWNSGKECPRQESKRQMLSSIQATVERNELLAFSVMELKNQLKQLQEKVDTKMGCYTPSAEPHNCADILNHGDKMSGIRTVYPFERLDKRQNRALSVFCDQTTDGGGWTVIQRRDDLPEREDFFRGWKEYADGFGKLEEEFWLGLENIHALVTDIPMELRVDLEDLEGEKRWAKYGLFSISDANGNYSLFIGMYSGNAGDSLSSYNERHFSTEDHNLESCVDPVYGGWWDHDCPRHRPVSNLNGYHHNGTYTSYQSRIFWHGFRGFRYSLKRTSMSLRPKFRH